MYGKVSFKELTELESKYDLWQHTFLGYPLWIHCREPMMESGMLAERRIPHISVGNMAKSFFQTLSFLIMQKRYKKVFFLMERAELLEVYHQETEQRKILFVNPEQQKVLNDGGYIRSDFLNLLRFLSRKSAFILFFPKYRKTVHTIVSQGFDQKLSAYIKVAMGDALFLRFLSLILTKKNEKFYSGCIVPLGEKFLNSLNSIEVQHGVIYPEHIGYMGIPKVHNRLMVYHKAYKKTMQKHGYTGEILVNEFKRDFLEKTVERKFPIVIYTQPILKMQEGIERFLKSCCPKNVYIQKHPKDYFDYSIDKQFLVTGTSPGEVDYPIVYTSTIVENFLITHKKCYIYNVKHADFDLKGFLQIYNHDGSGELVIHDTLEVLYEIIMKEKQ